MIQLLVIAKAPVPGRVKTRLCPPCAPEQAAAIAAAALADTLEVAAAVPAARHTLVLDGEYPVPPDWRSVPQRGAGLGERLAHAFADTALPGVPALLIGMDTPQLTAGLLTAAAEALEGPDGALAGAGGELEGAGAVLGPADDGGWWALGLRDPAHAAVLRGVPMSRRDTGARTLAALRHRAVEPILLPRLRDCDTAADAVAIAAACPPGRRFPAAVARHLPGAPEARAGQVVRAGGTPEARAGQVVRAGGTPA
jgi:hypothetical protein